MSERVPLFDSYYFAFWEDGTFGHSDGVGFCGETSAEEVRALFEVMQKFYAAQHRVQRTGLWRCKDCGSENGVEYAVCVKCKSPRR